MPADLEELTAYLAEFPEIVRERVLLMPQGIEQQELDARALWLRPYCEANRFVFCPRKHIEWYGPVRGT
jgi:7-carboxy-7-deazaguanine synthase